MCLNVCGTPLKTSARTLRAFPSNFFSSLLEQGPEDALTIDLDFSMEAVQVLLATLRAARSSVNLAFKAVQCGLDSACGVELLLLFDYVGLGWLLPTRMPSEFDDPSRAMEARFEHFDFNNAWRSVDVTGVLHYLHIAPPGVRGWQQLCAVVLERAMQLNALDAVLVSRETAWSAGKNIKMPLTGEHKLILDLGPGSALFPTGIFFCIHPPPPSRVTHITVSALSEITGESRVILRCHMPVFCQCGPDQSDYVLIRAPVAPWLRELFRMFMFSVTFEDAGDLSWLEEVELFGDYVGCLHPEATSCRPPLFHFKEEYASYTQGTFVLEA